MIASDLTTSTGLRRKCGDDRFSEVAHQGPVAAATEVQLREVCKMRKKIVIRQTHNNRHWNYFLALDRDAAVIARFVEFSTDNFGTYSIELARLLMAAASEVDVVAKLACVQIDPKAAVEGIGH